MAPVRIPALIIALALAIFALAPASAEVPDQSSVPGPGVDVEIRDELDFEVSVWQTFVAGHTGRLTSIELLIGTAFGPDVPGLTHPPGDIAITLVETGEGIPFPDFFADPDATIDGDLGYFGGPLLDNPTLLRVEMTGEPILLDAGTRYAIQIDVQDYTDSTRPIWSLYTTPSDDPYPGGYYLHEDLLPPGDVKDIVFRTNMEFCGDGTQQAGEACDDGNTISGDGCSAECVEEACGDGTTNEPTETCDDGNTVPGDGCSATCQDEYCGDGVTNDVAETCDDGNTVAGDGCSASCQDEYCGDGVVNFDDACDDGNTVPGDGCSAACTLEKPGTACRTAIAAATQKYVTARLAALQQCRIALGSGKPLSVSTPSACPAEAAAAKKIAKAAGQARKAIAGGARPKCTDALVAALGTCADTVDGLVAPDATAGCLLDAGDSAVDALLDEVYTE